MMSAKLGTLSFLKINAFWNITYDVIIFVHDVTMRILALNSNYTVDLVMWPLIGDSTISMREFITSIFYGFYGVDWR